ncbi:MAG TPA: PhnD/SsuA/transferrin family substrate-binding protein, partial [Candidatus Thermoplasmatota archaeon]|nr:PhnD/SsuA/transferrin family substrate-binding protein [Candidatus Thermoplasmatota archaeon]
KPADPKEFFGEVVMAGSYDNAWKALQEGQVDVAVIAGDVKESTYRTVMNNTRVVETQGPVPSHAVVYAEDFKGTELANKLTAALLELKDDKQPLMRQLMSGIFVRFEETTSAEHGAGLKVALDRVGGDYGAKI